ncbi:RRM_1 domain-containing protein/NTF2 domain-containing protein [Cephalotus follicularis]|uniref:RRM_1 domain-containing protein/NTF2 domain-containing protein n=1 Tax=Cephalotus follicularis TaxID=3775 RepID=A0A1Q3CUJ9_CEPFO|nr:RRM_1 domain-containing protein/NTF2 domain-containing protein [Cephalotus follicularis]
MALQTDSPPTSPPAQVVGNAFIEQYYHILHQSPELVFRFYKESSVLSRPDSNGVMVSVTTMQGINEKILSLDYKNSKAEIKTADSQKSYKDGVTVLVTGCLTGKDSLRRKFAQSFFLAPQDNGYFVLNDVFRYVEDDEPLESQPIDTDDASIVNSVRNPEPAHVANLSAPDLATTVEQVHQNVSEKAYDSSDHEIQIIQSVNEDEGAIDSQLQSNGNHDPAVVESTSSSAQDDHPKKSYASIVKVMKGSPGVTKIYVPTSTAKAAAKKTENQAMRSVTPAPVTEASSQSSTGILERSNSHEEADGHSIYIRNLPFNMTDSQLEAEFKKFGPIKRGGIQIRYHKQQGYCFGFVEFHSLSSMNDAIQASPITIGGRQAVIEAKRTTARGGSVRGRFYSGRGGFRNDSFRNRGSYGGGGWSFGRNEDGTRGEFSGRGRGPGHGGEGRGRGGRPSGPK